MSLRVAGSTRQICTLNFLVCGDGGNCFASEEGKVVELRLSLVVPLANSEQDSRQSFLDCNWTELCVPLERIQSQSAASSFQFAFDFFVCRLELRQFRVRATSSRRIERKVTGCRRWPCEIKSILFSDNFPFLSSLCRAGQPSRRDTFSSCNSTTAPLVQVSLLRKKRDNN